MQSIYGSIGFMATEKLTITLSGYVAKNTAELDEVIMPVPEESLEHLDYTYEDMYTYSDLNYLTYKAGMGVDYLFRSGLKWTAEGTLYGIDDRLGYVFGDESGTYLVVRTGVQIDF